MNSAELALSLSRYPQCIQSKVPSADRLMTEEETVLTLPSKIGFGCGFRPSISLTLGMTRMLTTTPIRATMKLAKAILSLRGQGDFGGTSQLISYPVPCILMLLLDFQVPFSIDVSRQENKREFEAQRRYLTKRTSLLKN